MISKIGESPTKCGSSFPNRDPLYDIKKTFWNYMAFSRAKHFLLYDIKQLFLKNSRIPIVGHFWKCCYLTKLLVLVFYHDSICTDFKEFKHYRNILSSTNATLWCTDWIFLQNLLRPKYYGGFDNPESWESSQIMKALKKNNGSKKPLTKETEYNIEKCLNKC